MQENNSQIRSAKKSRIFTNILTTAVKLWLRSQVSQIFQLEVDMRASNHQILSGCLPWVSIYANHPIYRGLHLTQVQLAAENIHINIGSVLKGQPLRLLETVPVFCELIQGEDDFNASLCCELLTNALNDVLITVLPEHSTKSKSIRYKKINFDHSKLILAANLVNESNSVPLNLTVGIEFISNHELQITPIKMEINTVVMLDCHHNRHYLNLGSDVDIQELNIIPGRLECRGRININP